MVSVAGRLRCLCSSCGRYVFDSLLLLLFVCLFFVCFFVCLCFFLGGGGGGLFVCFSTEVSAGN